MLDSFRTPWTVAGQAPLSMGLARQEYWSGLPFPFPGDLPDSGIKPTSPALAGGLFTTEPYFNLKKKKKERERFLRKRKQLTFKDHKEVKLHKT